MSKIKFKDLRKGHKPNPIGLEYIPSKKEKMRILKEITEQLNIPTNNNSSNEEYKRTLQSSGHALLDILETGETFSENMETTIKKITDGHKRLAEDDARIIRNIGKGRYEYNYRGTVVGVVYKCDEFLPVKKSHWRNWWDFPQEGIKKGESLEQALLRGLHEELGSIYFGVPVDTKIKFKRKFSKETLIHYSDRGYVGKSLYYFVVPYLGKKSEIKLGDDLIDKKWCDKNKLIDLLYKPEIDIAKKVIKFMENNSYLE